jgi:hypothetical protein
MPAARTNNFIKKTHFVAIASLCFLVMVLNFVFVEHSVADDIEHHSHQCEQYSKIQHAITYSIADLNVQRITMFHPQRSATHAGYSRTVMLSVRAPPKKYFLISLTT